MSASSEPQVTAPGWGEAEVLAREAAAAFGGLVAWYTEHYKLSHREAVVKAEEASSPPVRGAPAAVPARSGHLAPPA
jgi:hypothetical protein